MRLPGWLQASTPRRTPDGTGVAVPVQVQLRPDPELAAKVRRAIEHLEQQLARPDAVVGQSLAAAYDYLAERGWLDGPRPKVMSTAPQGPGWGRVVLVITDPTTLDHDLWHQLRGRDRLAVVVRP